MSYLKLRRIAAPPGATSLLPGVAALAAAMLIGSADVRALDTPSTPAAGSLYERLGGTENVTAIIDEMIDRASTDPATKRSFRKVGLKRLKHVLVEYICYQTGGGCTYTGDSMRDAHGGLGISQSEFYGLVETLRDAMRDHNVPLSARNDLLRILAPKKREIVER